MNSNSPKANLENHPLIRSYLTGLARALGETEEHDEVLESVREHIAEALSVQANPMDGKVVQQILDELGPVERIVAAQVEPHAMTQAPARSWATIGAGIVAIASLALVFLIPFVAIPLALGSLIIGVAVVIRQTSSRKLGAWIVIFISSLTLVIALAGAFFLLPAGTDGGVQSSVPAKSAALGR